MAGRHRFGSTRPVTAMRTAPFTALALGLAVALAAATTALVRNDYFFSASYTVLQFVVLATAWNILGGFTGYVNFGSAAFFALGAYATIALHTAVAPPMIVSIAA